MPLMPCTPPKARALLKAGQARPKRNKLGLFYLELTYEQEPNNQRLVVGIDPGSAFEGYSVVGTKETVCNLMVEAPTHVKNAIQTRRAMRRARRFRLWRRPCRSNNRLARKHRLPPSTRSRWEAKARIVRHLATMLPLTDAAVEDVQAATQHGSGGQWNAAFSPVQVGKEHLYRLLKDQGLNVHLYTGTRHQPAPGALWPHQDEPEGGADIQQSCGRCLGLAAATSGATAPTCARVWYGVPLRLHRRQLHRLEAAKGGIRKPYGGSIPRLQAGNYPRASDQWTLHGRRQ